MNMSDSRSDIFSIMRETLQLDNDDVADESDVEEDEEDVILEDSNDDSDSDLQMGDCRDYLCSDKEECKPCAKQDEMSFTGKDDTVWSKTPNMDAMRAAARNIYRGPITGKPNSSVGMLVYPVDVANLFINNIILEHVVQSTNDHVRTHDGSLEDWKDTDVTEIRALIGLWIIIGALQLKLNKPLSELWDSRYGVTIVRATFTYERFRCLMKYIRFDNAEDIEIRREGDKLAPVRAVFDIFNKNWLRYYTPGPYLTVDKQLVSLHGKCPFKIRMPQTPDKYGMKIFFCCDSQTFYPLSAIPYCGKDETGIEEQLTSVRTTSSCTLARSSKYVFDLVHKFFGSGRNVTVCSYFTSLELAQMLTNQQLTMVGACHHKRSFLPKEFLSRKESVGNALYGYRKNAMLVSFHDKPEKTSILLSTLHSTGSVAEKRKNKPEVILFYDETKKGVHSLDQLVQQFMCRCQTNRWPVAFFMNLIDISMIAAFVIWMSKHPDWSSCDKKSSVRRHFLQAVGESLVQPHIEQRQRTSMETHIQDDIGRTGLVPTVTDVGASALAPTGIYTFQQQQHLMQQQLLVITTSSQSSSCDEPNCKDLSHVEPNSKYSVANDPQDISDEEHDQNISDTELDCKNILSVDSDSKLFVHGETETKYSSGSGNYKQNTDYFSPGQSDLKHSLPYDPYAMQFQKGAKRKRCYICKHSVDRKHRDVCGKCLEHICKDHSVYICIKCANEVSEPDMKHFKGNLKRRRRCYICPHKADRKCMTVCPICEKNMCRQHSFISCVLCQKVQI